MMDTGWQAYLSAQGAHIDSRNVHGVRDFGDPQGELIAARDATIVAPLTHLALIECAGPDARTFLHNQLTSDVNHLAAEGAHYAAWCSAKGRMLASLILFRRDADYLALLSSDLREFVLERLRIYILRSQVKLIDRSASGEIIGVSGPKALAALQNAGLEAPLAVSTTARFDGGSLIHLDNERYIVIAGTDAAPLLWQRLSAAAVPAGAPAWQWLDVAAGVPWITEAIREAFVPQMAGFDRIGGVSFHKGCYPGQEVIARTQYLGKVKRHLYRTHASGPIAAGMTVFPAGAPDQPCGQIVNAAAAPGGGYDSLAVILEDAIGRSGLRAALPEGGSIELSEPLPI